MHITTKLKRHSSSSWARHTDNCHGGRGKINVRKGKRFLRKELNNYLKRILKDYE